MKEISNTSDHFGQGSDIETTHKFVFSEYTYKVCVLVVTLCHNYDTCR